MCSQIYPDPQAEKAIMASVVYCIHHKEGCAWAGELRKLKVRIWNESIPSQIASQFATFVCVSLFHRSRKQVYYIYAGGSPELVRTCLEGLSLLSQLGAPPGRHRQVCAHLLIAHPCESNPLKATRSRAGNTKSSNFREKGFYLFVPGCEWIFWSGCDTFFVVIWKKLLES